MENVSWNVFKVESGSTGVPLTTGLDTGEWRNPGYTLTTEDQ